MRAVSLLRAAAFFGVNRDTLREKQGIARGISESEKKVKKLNTMLGSLCFHNFFNGTVILRSQGCMMQLQGAE